jgi:hypothetical protein
MDISKLPRMSKTEGQAPSTEPPPAAGDSSQPAPVHVAVMYHEPGLGLEMWITVILALLFLALGRDFAKYAIAVTTHQTYHTGATWQEGPNAGQEVPYTQLDASFGLPVWSDSGMFFFGTAMLVSAGALAVSALRWRASRAIGWFALAALVGAIFYNCLVAAKLMGANITPLLSLVCIGLGGYEVYLQYRAIKGPSRN